MLALKLAVAAETLQPHTALCVWIILLRALLGMPVTASSGVCAESSPTSKLELLFIWRIADSIDVPTWLLAASVALARLALLLPARASSAALAVVSEVASSAS